MPTAKKTMKLRDQKPAKDPVGGNVRHGGGRHHLNTVGTEGGTGKNERRGRSRFN